MAEEFDTNKQPSFHILISLIEIWTPANPKKPNGVVSGEVMRITEVKEVEIEESFKKLISTAVVRFPRGTIIRKTIPAYDPNDPDYDGEYSNYITASLSDSGVLEEKRASSSVATTETFKVGQRIKIYLGYTQYPETADRAKSGTGKPSIYTDSSQYDLYRESFLDVSVKKYTGLMFDGYITKVSLDTPIELECENLASHLKRISCPKARLSNKPCEVKDLLGDDGRFKLLKNTGLILHPDTAAMDFDFGGCEVSPELTVADVLTQWAKYGIFCYVSDYNGQPALQIGRAYFSNPGKDSLVNVNASVVPIHFDYHVANNGLTLMSTDKAFLAVEAQGIIKGSKGKNDDQFAHITIIRNPDYDPSQEESEANSAYRKVNESKLSKKALKAGKRYVSDAPNDKVDMTLYNKISFVSKKRDITMEELAEEAIKYLEGFNMTGIEGSLTLFGDLKLHSAAKVELIDKRYPGKQGIYLVEEVSTTFGTDGFRQKITIPYCIKRDGNA